jgi:hypothetical protein
LMYDKIELVKESIIKISKNEKISYFDLVKDKFIWKEEE